MTVATRISLAQQILLKRAAQLDDAHPDQSTPSTSTLHFRSPTMWENHAGWHNPAGWENPAGWNNFDNKPWENASGQPGLETVLRAIRTDRSLLRPVVTDRKPDVR